MTAKTGYWDNYDFSKVEIKTFVPRKFTAQEIASRCDHEIIQPRIDFRYCVKCDWNQGS